MSYWVKKIKQTTALDAAAILPILAMNSWEPEEELVDGIPEEMRVKMEVALSEHQ